MAWLVRSVRVGRRAVRGGWALAVLVAVGVVSVSGAADVSDAPVRPTIPLPEERIDRAIDRAAAQARERASAQARERRARSRSAHRGLGRDAALQLAEAKHAGLLGRPLGPQLKLAAGQRLVRYLGDSSALIDVGDRNTVATSTVPLAVRDGGGGWAPADLDLVPARDGFSVRRPLVAARVGRHARDAATIGTGGLAVTPLVGAADTDPALDAGRVFWANARTDTDVLALPVPAGLEVAYMLRSPDAPESLTLGLSLPDGARAQRDSAGAGGVEITAAGKSIATISRPVAADANGQPVGVGYELRDGDLAMRVDHRGADLEYPIAVDPAIELEQEWQDTHQSKVGWWAGNVCCWNSEWHFRDWDVGAGDGLNTYHDAGDYGIHSRGDWARTTPGDSYIESISVRSIQWWLADSCIFIGISRYAGGAYPWLNTYEACRDTTYPHNVNNGYFYGVGPMNAHDRAPDKYYAVLAHYLPEQYGNGWRGFHMTHWGNVEIWYGDTGRPANPSPSGLPGGWVNPDRTATTWSVTSTDGGVGVKTLEVDGPWSGGVEFRSDHHCNGTFDNLCNTTRIDDADQPNYKPDGRHTLQADLKGVPDGDWPLQARATDLGSLTNRPLTENSSFVGIGRAKVDRVSPAIAFRDEDDAHNSSLLDEENASGTYDLGASEYDLDIRATDARSGLGYLEVSVDGVVKYAANGVTDGAPLEHLYTFDTAAPGQGDGHHTIVIKARDRAGNWAPEKKLEVDVDRNADPRSDDGTADTDGEDGQDGPDLADSCEPDPEPGATADAGAPYCGEMTELNREVITLRRELTTDLDVTLSSDRAAATIPNTASSLQRGGTGYGLSEQQFYLKSIQDDPKLPALGLKKARVVVPYNVMTASGGRYDHAVRETLFATMNYLQQSGFAVLIAFERDKEDVEHLPTVSEYINEVKIFRGWFPQVKTFESWNEPNWKRQPTSREVQDGYGGARQAGRFYRSLQQLCDADTANPCVAVAGAFVDTPALFERDKRYIDEYQKGTGYAAWRKPLWSIHTYGEAYGNRDGTGRNRRAVEYLLRRTRTPDGNTAPDPHVWITEGGGRLDVHRSRANRRGDANLAGEDLDYLMQSIVTGLSKRIRRFYYYSYMGGRRFDSGLVKYYSPCPRAQPCATTRDVVVRDVRPQLYNRFKAYSNPASSP